MTEKEALIALNMVSGIGAIFVKRLFSRLGSYAAIFEASEAELCEVSQIGAYRAQSLLREIRQVDWAREIARAERLNVGLTTWLDEAYPKQLLEIPDPPLVIYSRGSLESLNQCCIAMVGTRRATVYGREVAKKLAYQLAGAGYTIVSGLATGIDGESHRGAVLAHGKTVGVLGGALNCFYPKENTALAKEMVESGGAVMTEYPLDRVPDRQTFPMRNRIVSGLCQGVLVVESPLSSGTMITVQDALDHNRTVMCVPGRIDSPSSQGCHKLIREGARLVTSADEVMEEMDDLIGMAERRKAKSGTAAGAVPAEKREVERQRPQAVLTPEERKVYEALTSEGVLIDSIIRSSGLPSGKVSAILIGLQIRRLARTLPGGRVGLLNP